MTPEKKTDYKHGKFTILTNEVDTDNFFRGDYEEWCEDNGIEAGVGDYFEEGFLDWCADETQANYEADMDNIKHCKEYDVPVVVEGTLGLWWGRPSIEPERFECVADAIEKCIGDCNYVEVEYNDGVLNVHATHHDGTNCFTIKALSKKGIAKQYAEYKKHDFKRLPYLYAL